MGSAGRRVAGGTVEDRDAQGVSGESHVEILVRDIRTAAAVGLVFGRNVGAGSGGVDRDWGFFVDVRFVKWEGWSVK